MAGRNSSAPATSIRAAGLLTAVLGSTAVVRPLVDAPLRSAADLVTTGGAAPLTVLVAGGCALALAACWAWLALCAVAVAVDALRPGAAVDHHLPGCPRAVRTIILAALGVAVGSGPAAADTGTGPGVVGLPLPDRVSAAPASVDRSPPLVRVRRGDSLWAIASRRLPSGATDAAVTRAWHRLAAANTDRVSDPDLIFPGTVLRVPDLGSTTDHPLGKESS